MNINKRKALLAVFCFLLVHITFAQKVKTYWGEEFKLRKGSTDLAVFYADKSGIYLSEEHQALKGYFVIAATTRTSATLVKLDNSLGEIYRNDFNKELKGKEFDDFFMLGDKLYVFASDYDKKTKVYTLFASEINKTDGQISGDWKEVTTWEKETKSERFDYKRSYNQDSTSMIIVSTNDKAENDYFQLKEFDKNLKQVGKTTTISTEFNSKTFKLEDVFYTKSKTTILVGRNYEYAQGKKQKAKNLEFSNYTINLYDDKGKLIKEINTTIDGKWLMNTKVISTKKNEVALAAFYSDTKKGREINGMLVQRINSQTGDVVSTASKPINTSLITAVQDDEDDDDDKESKKERKEREKLEKMQEEEGGISRYMRFTNVLHTPDDGLVIVAEKYKYYTYTTTTTTGTGASMRTTTRTYAVYELGDIMMTKVKLDGKIDWLHILPKFQREVIQIGSGSGPGSGISVGVSYFGRTYNMPYYAGMASLVMPGSNNIAILFNDNPKNDNVLQAGQKPKSAYRFTKTICALVTLDPITGKYTRKSLFSNSDQPPAMVRFGEQVGNNFYLVGKEDRLMGKTKIAVCKLTF